MMLIRLPGMLSDAAVRVRYGSGSDSAGIGSAENELGTSRLVTGFWCKVIAEGTDGARLDVRWLISDVISCGMNTGESSMSMWVWHPESMSGESPMTMIS